MKKSRFRVGDRVLCNNPTIEMDDLPGVVEEISDRTMRVRYDCKSPQTGTIMSSWTFEYVRLDPKYLTKLHRALL